MIKLILGAVIGVALYTSVAKADTETVTPKEFVNTVASVPHKVSTHLQNEWVDIKEYQNKERSIYLKKKRVGPPPHSGSIYFLNNSRPAQG